MSFRVTKTILAASRQPRVMVGNISISHDTRTVIAAAIVMVWLVWNYWVASKSLPLPNVACAQDLGVMVDAGYRFYQGMRAHADYHTPFGPVLGMLFGIPMLLGGPNYASLKFLPATVTGITVAWTWFACSYSLGAASRAVIAIALGAIAGGIYHQGFPPEALTFATFYNRVAFGILGVVALCSLLPRELNRAVSNAFRDCSIVIGLFTLAFLKSVFAVAALPFVLTSLVVHPRTKQGYGICLAVGMVCTAFFLTSIGFRVDRMWHDLLLSARARGQNGGTGLFFFPLRNAMANIDFICLAIISGVLWLPAAVTPSSMRRSSTAWGMYLLWIPVLVGWGLTLIQSHGDGRGIALILVGLAASCAWLSVKPGDVIGRVKCPESPPGESLTDSIRHRVSAACLWLAAFLFIIPHAQSLLFLQRISSETSGRQFRAPAVCDLFIGPFANELGPDCIAKMNDAIDLIGRHCERNDTLQYMGGANIYSFACGLRSPRDSMLFWCSYSTYSAAHHPPTRDFDATEFILVPKATVSVSRTPEDWKQAYSYYFASHFTVCEETQYFLLYKRKA